MISLLQLPFVHNPGPGLALHFSRLQADLQKIYPDVAVVNGTSPASISRSISNHTRVFYLMGHTNAQLGLNISPGSYLSGKSWRSCFNLLTRPQLSLVFLNTCHGIETGLAQAAIDAGAKTVIAASGTIPTKHMADYAEEFFRLWTSQELSAEKTVQLVNDHFKDGDIQFTCLGDGMVTFEAIRQNSL